MHKTKVCLLAMLFPYKRWFLLFWLLPFALLYSTVQRDACRSSPNTLHFEQRDAEPEKVWCQYCVKCFTACPHWLHPVCCSALLWQSHSLLMTQPAPLLWGQLCWVSCVLCDSVWPLSQHLLFQLVLQMFCYWKIRTISWIIHNHITTVLIINEITDSWDGLNITNASRADFSASPLHLLSMHLSSSTTTTVLLL